MSYVKPTPIEVSCPDISRIEWPRDHRPAGGTCGRHHPGRWFSDVAGGSTDIAFMKTGLFIVLAIIAVHHAGLAKTKAPAPATSLR